MTLPKQQPKRPVGRPPSGRPPRKRQLLSLERDEILDNSIDYIKRLLASQDKCSVEDITTTRAIRFALAYTISHTPNKRGS